MGWELSLTLSYPSTATVCEGPGHMMTKISASALGNLAVEGRRRSGALA